ncbi:MAG: DMT family transporter [Chlorobi bacterium]|nr:DMT family transporter [Chlorobiota bacterium]
MTKLQANLLLFLTAIIWGFSFVAQRAGMEFVGPYTFNAVRFALGSLSLVPLVYFLKGKKRNNLKRETKPLIIGGLLAGSVLFIASSFQQVGIVYTSAGNAGFITTLYVIIVPVLGLFLKHKINKQTWVGAILAIIGLYLLSVKGSFSLGKGDSLVLVSAFFFAAHVIIIGFYTDKVNAIKISIVQFAVCSLLSLAVAVFIEEIVWATIKQAAIPVLYGGLMSVGVAFTLQVVAQRKALASHAAIILSFESLFAVLGGWLILNEGFTTRALIGCWLGW